VEALIDALALGRDDGDVQEPVLRGERLAEACTCCGVDLGWPLDVSVM